MAPMKLAIIGAGPSAFYVASRLLSLIPHASANSSSSQLGIHMFDRLWAPHGLVRYGVAPDHPEVKNVTHKFDAAASDPRFRFFGNVDIGSSSPSIPNTIPVPLSSLFANYTHVVFSTGCTEPTLHPSLPPSPYCIPAISLVHWYTQHPSHPPAPPLERVTHVSIIGNGNVSLDIARILLSPVSLLSKYDVPSPVLNVLSRSQINHISIFGRRGPFEAAFTTKELRELINLPNTSMLPLPPQLLTPPQNPPLTRQQSRILQLLQKGSPTRSPGAKTWSLEFFRSPVSLTPPSSTSPSSPFANLTLAHTTLDSTHTRAIPTGEHTTLPTSLVVTSLGFRASSSLPFYDPALGHLRTDPMGRVVVLPASTSSGHHVTPGPASAVIRNVYASGWTATGAKGVLAATMMNAYALAETIISDWVNDDIGVQIQPSPDIDFSVGAAADGVDQGSGSVMWTPTLKPPHLSDPPPEVVLGLKEGKVTTYDDWKAVDAEEVRRGEVAGKERERMGWEEARTFLAFSQGHSNHSRRDHS